MAEKISLQRGFLLKNSCNYVILFYPQLIIGDFSLSYEQSKAQFAMWSIMASVSRLGVQMNCTLSLYMLLLHFLITGNMPTLKLLT